MNQIKLKVCALINKEDKILIIKRSKRDKDYPGMWDIPSGDVEIGETIREALTREVKEETNLNIKMGNLSSIWEEKSNKEHLIAIVFEATTLNKEAKLSAEHEELRWISKEEIKSFNFAHGIKESLLKSNLLL